MTHLSNRDALILVDIQNDFLPGGTLAVPSGDEIIPVANRMIDRFAAARGVVIATQDWHPPDHSSFASQHPAGNIGDTIVLDGLDQVLWPDHCVQHTHGAALADQLRLGADTCVVRKGTDRNIDSYSGFFDNAQRRATGLETLLRSRQLHRVFVMGLATDYCVKFTALDACRLGFPTTLIQDGCRGVNLEPTDSVQAVREMEAAGVSVADSTPWS